MPPPLPIIIRLHLALLRVALAFQRLAWALLQASAWGWTPAARRDEVTAALYARQPRYLPGGATFDGGFYPWEEEALSLPEWPRSGKILLGGAGGGRELRVLAGRGYSVRAFEPLATFADAGARLCAALPGCALDRGSYRDLVDALSTGTGPLSGVVAEAPFDAVILGWGSLAHVTDPAEVDAVFKACKALGPRAPLLTSVYTPEILGQADGRAERLGELAARLFAAVGAPGRRPTRGAFLPNGGFILGTTPEEFRALAASHGYAVVRLSTSFPQPWALLVPEVRRDPTS